MKSHIRTWGIAALLGAALSLFCILPCLAAGSVGQVTLHIGQTPDTAYLTYSAPDAVHGAVTVTGPAGTAALLENRLRIIPPLSKPDSRPENPPGFESRQARRDISLSRLAD